MRSPAGDTRAPPFPLDYQQLSRNDFGSSPLHLVILQYFALTAAWAGDKEVALQQLEAGLRAPQASEMLSYGALKLFPVWDPLRGEPRFAQIVRSLAPK